MFFYDLLLLGGMSTVLVGRLHRPLYLTCGTISWLLLIAFLLYAAS